MTEAKKARAIRQIGLLESMVENVDKENESEENHGKFEEMKIKIMSKCRVLESLMGEEQGKKSLKAPIQEEEDVVSLAKRMDQELQL